MADETTMPTTVLFWGSSDDLIEVEGEVPGCDEYYAIESRPHEFLIEAPDGTAMLVTGFFGAEGSWSFAPGLLNEDHPYPSWPVVVRPASNGYSTVLEICVPAGARITSRSGGAS